jgi:hypothetical protein
LEGSSEGEEEERKGGGEGRKKEGKARIKKNDSLRGLNMYMW